MSDLIQLGGYDMVLGIQWLKQLGVIMGLQQLDHGI